MSSETFGLASAPLLMMMLEKDRRAVTPERSDVVDTPEEDQHILRVTSWAYPATAVIFSWIAGAIAPVADDVQ